MIKKIIFIVCIVVSCCQVYGQRYSQLSMTMFNPYKDHSSFAGMDRKLSISTQIRSQWSGIEGRPSLQYVGVHLPMYIWGGAIGADVVNENQGNLNFTMLRGSYNNVKPMFGGLLSLGARVGVGTLRLTGGDIRTPDGSYSDGQIVHNDPLLDGVNTSGVSTSFELSALYRATNFQTAISVYDPISVSTKINELQFKKRAVANVYFQYNYKINRALQLLSSVNLKSDLAYLQTDIGGVVRYKGDIYAGMMLRGYNKASIDAIALVAGHNINDKFSIFYSYDFGLSSLRYVNEGSHELVLKYNINTLVGTGLPPKIIHNPRFL